MFMALYITYDFYLFFYIFISSRNLWKVNLPILSGSTLCAHYFNYELDGVWYKERTSKESY